MFELTVQFDTQEQATQWGKFARANGKTISVPTPLSDAQLGDIISKALIIAEAYKNLRLPSIARMGD